MTRENQGPRIFVPNLSATLERSLNSILLLPADTGHHIKNVLRIGVGGPLELADPITGEAYKGSVASLDDGVSVRAGEKIEGARSSHISITLLFALCKGQKNEQVCDWATELGCSRIVFWQAERSVMRLHDERDRLQKESRYAKVVLAAAQQSRQPKPPDVSVTLSLHDALSLCAESSPSGAAKILCSLDPAAVHIRNVLTSPTEISSAIVVIGPEGDISPSEEAVLLKEGFTPTSLGSSVLRSELAAVTVVAFLGLGGG